MDELLAGICSDNMNCHTSCIFLNSSGMVTKSHGQVIHLAAVIHVLFTLGCDQPIDDVVSEDQLYEHCVN